MGYKIVAMTLIAPFVLSFFMNPSQLLVGILSAVLAYFSQWIVVGGFCFPPSIGISISVDNKHFSSYYYFFFLGCKILELSFSDNCTEI